MNEKLMIFSSNKFWVNPFLSRKCIDIITETEQRRMSWALYVKRHGEFLS